MLLDIEWYAVGYETKKGFRPIALFEDLFRTEQYLNKVYKRGSRGWYEPGRSLNFSDSPIIFKVAKYSNELEFVRMLDGFNNREIES